MTPRHKALGPYCYDHDDSIKRKRRMRPFRNHALYVADFVNLFHTATVNLVVFIIKPH